MRFIELDGEFINLAYVQRMTYGIEYHKQGCIYRECIFHFSSEEAMCFTLTESEFSALHIILSVGE